MFHQDIFMCVLSTALSYSYCNFLFSILCQAQGSSLLKDLVLLSKTLLCFVISHVLFTWSSFSPVRSTALISHPIMVFLGRSKGNIQVVGGKCWTVDITCVYLVQLLILLLPYKNFICCAFLGGWGCMQVWNINYHDAISDFIIL